MPALGEYEIVVDDGNNNQTFVALKTRNARNDIPLRNTHHHWLHQRQETCACKRV